MSPLLHLAVAGALDIPPAMLAPFALLLLLIATMPLTPAKVKHLWEHYYPHVAVLLGGLVAAYYWRQVPDGAGTVGHALHEYFSFICLIGSLFVVAGGIHLKVKGEGTPLANVVFLAVAAVLTNVIGTTGASMLFIRPWIRVNKYRISAFHIVFFIFIVANCGGALTPIGDPPLFLGYLRGVPFFWLVEHALLPWALCVGLLLGLFYLYDRRSFARVAAPVRQHALAEHETWRFDGAVNVLFLAAVVGAVFLPAGYFLREAVMLAAAVASWKFTPRGVHEENHFTFAPIKEVSWLFLGIFLTMMPALDYLAQHGREFGLTQPRQYYYAAGGLSAVLDNAPTYVNFLKLAEVTAAAEHPTHFEELAHDEVAAVRMLLATKPGLVIAVSLGAVFFGALTYIGNGPNFMVKSIAESAGVKVPTFFGYLLKYSLPLLLPILVLVQLFFV